MLLHRCKPRRLRSACLFTREHFNIAGFDSSPSRWPLCHCCNRHFDSHKSSVKQNPLNLSVVPRQKHFITESVCAVVIHLAERWFVCIWEGRIAEFPESRQTCWSSFGWIIFSLRDRVWTEANFLLVGFRNNSSPNLAGWSGSCDAL